MKENCVILFVNYPADKAASCELFKELGEERSKKLAEAFASDLFDALQDCDSGLAIFYAPGMKDIAKKFTAADICQEQSGDDPGEIRTNAFDTIFDAGCKQALLISANVPDLPMAHVRQGFASLNKYSGQCLGPASDGGYYLIGFTADQYLPDAFEDISWGSGNLFSEAMTRFATHGVAPVLLSGHSVVNTMDDLKALVERAKGTDFENSRTMGVIKELVPEAASPLP